MLRVGVEDPCLREIFCSSNSNPILGVPSTILDIKEFGGRIKESTVYDQPEEIFFKDPVAIRLFIVVPFSPRGVSFTQLRRPYSDYVSSSLKLKGQAPFPIGLALFGLLLIVAKAQDCGGCE